LYLVVVVVASLDDDVVDCIDGFPKVQDNTSKRDGTMEWIVMEAYEKEKHNQSNQSYNQRQREREQH
jgi:hypothetical protein